MTLYPPPPIQASQASHFAPAALTRPYMDCDSISPKEAPLVFAPLCNVLKYNSLNESTRTLENSTLDISWKSTLVFSHLSNLYNRTRAEIDRYTTYELNWDGYGGECFSVEVLSVAMATLDRVQNFFGDFKSAPDELFSGPASDGSLDLEIACGRKRLIITFSVDSLSGEFYAEVEGKGKAVVASFGTMQLEEWLRWLVDSPPVQVQLD